LPYYKNSDLPDHVKSGLPDHGQDLYREAYNDAWDIFRDPARRDEGRDHEACSHDHAWAAIEAKYEQNSRGSWRIREVNEDALTDSIQPESLLTDSIEPGNLMPDSLAPEM
jgi:cation transport regulator